MNIKYSNLYTFFIVAMSIWVHSQIKLCRAEPINSGIFNVFNNNFDFLFHSEKLPAILVGQKNQMLLKSIWNQKRKFQNILHDLS